MLDAKPREAARKTADREVNLQNSSMNGIAGRFRTVKNWRRIEPDIASFGQTNCGPAPLNNRLHFAFMD